MNDHDQIRAYRIGWGRLARLAGEYRRLLPMIAKGVQGDGQRVPRRRWLPKIRRDLTTVFTHHPKYLLHRPWQAEAEGPRFARRGLTAATAERRMRADVEHEQRTGERGGRVLRLAVVSTYPTEREARAALALLPGGQLGEYRGVWRTPAPYSGIVHLFSDDDTEVLTARGWTLVSSALPGDAPWTGEGS